MDKIEAEKKVKELNESVAERIWCPLYAGPCNKLCPCYRPARILNKDYTITNGGCYNIMFNRY